MEKPPPPPDAQIANSELPKKQGWGTVQKKNNPLNIEEVLARKRAADAAAAKVCLSLRAQRVAVLTQAAKPP